jgi:hypothetical protein
MELNRSDIFLALISNKQACPVLLAIFLSTEKVNGDLDQSNRGLFPLSPAGTEHNKTTPVWLVCGS